MYKRLSKTFVQTCYTLLMIGVLLIGIFLAPMSLGQESKKLADRPASPSKQKASAGKKGSTTLQDKTTLTSNPILTPNPGSPPTPKEKNSNVSLSPEAKVTQRVPMAKLVHLDSQDTRIDGLQWKSYDIPLVEEDTEQGFEISALLEGEFDVKKLIGKRVEHQNIDYRVELERRDLFFSDKSVQFEKNQDGMWRFSEKVRLIGPTTTIIVRAVNSKNKTSKEEKIKISLDSDSWHTAVASLTESYYKTRYSVIGLFVLSTLTHEITDKTNNSSAQAVLNFVPSIVACGEANKPRLGYSLCLRVGYINMKNAPNKSFVDSSQTLFLAKVGVHFPLPWIKHLSLLGHVGLTERPIIVAISQQELRLVKLLMPMVGVKLSYLYPIKNQFYLSTGVGIDIQLPSLASSYSAKFGALYYLSLNIGKEIGQWGSILVGPVLSGQYLNTNIEFHTELEVGAQVGFVARL